MPKSRRFQDLPLGERPAGRPLHRWLYEELRRSILGGRLQPGSRLPSTRDLAAQHRLARATVVGVFEQLLAEGYITSRTGSGTVVAQQLPDRFVSAAAHPPASKLAARPPSAPPPRPFEIHTPAVDVFPLAMWTQVASRRLRLGGMALLQRGDPRGLRSLREAIAAHLAHTRSVHCDPEQIMIVSGTQHALDFVARIVLRPGDQAWVEEPGYPEAAAALADAGARIVPVPVDAHGLDVSAGERRSPAPRFVYVTPAHQFPLGHALSLERRLALLALAQRTRGWIFEDDYDGAYRYDVRPLGAMQGHDRAGRVIYAGSFNKLLFPTLRLGYLVLPPALIDPFLALRNRVDRHPAVLEQAVLADFMHEGHFDRHVRRCRTICIERRDALLAAAARELAGRIEFATPSAGFHAIGRLAPGLTDVEVARRAETAGVDVTPVSRYYRSRPATDRVLFGFAPFKPPALRLAVATLARALSGKSAR